MRNLFLDAAKALAGKGASKREEKRINALLLDKEEEERLIIQEKMQRCFNKETPCKQCPLLKNGLKPYHDREYEDVPTHRTDKDAPIVLVISGSPCSSETWVDNNKYGDFIKTLCQENFYDNGVEQVYFASAVQCPVTNFNVDEDSKEPPASAVKACSNYLAYKLTQVDPDVIVCLGKTPASCFGITGRVKDMYNRIYDVAPMPKFNAEEGVFNGTVCTRPAKLIVTYTLEQAVEDFAFKNSMEAAFRQAARLAKGSVLETPQNYYLLESAAEFKDWVDRHLEHPKLKDRVHAFDIETNGRWMHPKKESELATPPKLRCVSFSWAPGMAICVPYEQDPEGYHPILKKFMESGVPFTGHNVAFDIYFLKLVNNIDTKNLVGDTMLMAALLNPGKGQYGYGLKPIAAELTDLGGYETDMKSIEDDKDEYGNIIKTKWEKVSMDVMAPYNCADADSTLQIFTKFYADIRKQNMRQAHWVMTHALFPLADMEHNGFMVDRAWVNNTRDVLIRLEQQFSKELADLRPEPNKGKVDDWGSPDRISEILVQEFRVDMKEISKDPLVSTLVREEKESVGDVILAAIRIPFTQTLRKWRKVSKLLSTYINGYFMNTGLDGRLRAKFNIVGTVTGRLSSSGDANLQSWRPSVVTQR